MSPKLYVSYLRKKGVSVGEGVQFFGLVKIELARPCLVEIGKNCILVDGVTILTHGYDWAVLREKYGEMLCSSGKVVLEENVFVGTNAVILKGVRIGRNTIIGAGAVVTHDIPANSVAVGNPCRVIMSIDEYYQKRKKLHVEEAKAYALELFKKTGKVPRQEDFWEEFPLFLSRNGNWGNLPVKKQLKSAMSSFMKSKPLYRSFNDFLIDSGIPPDKVEGK